METNGRKVLWQGQVRSSPPPPPPSLGLGPPPNGKARAGYRMRECLSQQNGDGSHTMFVPSYVALRSYGGCEEKRSDDDPIRRSRKAMSWAIGGREEEVERGRVTKGASQPLHGPESRSLSSSLRGSAASGGAEDIDRGDDGWSEKCPAPPQAEALSPL